VGHWARALGHKARALEQWDADRYGLLRCATIN